MDAEINETSAAPCAPGRRICWRKVAIWSSVAAFWASLAYCGFRPDDAAPSASRAGSIAAINKRINAIHPHYDARLLDGVYDCEDYAFAKLHALEALGVTGARVWAVRDETGRPHAIVQLSNGQVMDSRFSNMPTRGDIESFPGYRFIRAMSSIADTQVVDWNRVFAPKVVDWKAVFAADALKAAK